MNRGRPNDRFAPTRKSSAHSGRGGCRFGGRRPAAVRGEFALSRTITPALPAVEGLADPAPAVLGTSPPV
ncbi:hypothetical protein [Streptomyces flaveolus]|uniref:hypothetical protein n=1 Tax=Streptomyces flaveolus TaxID=67297 RepID=UPI003F4D9CF5